MVTDKYGRFKVTTKKGLVFELIVADWLKEGDYSFGKVESIEKLDVDHVADYISVVDSLFKMAGDEE